MRIASPIIAVALAYAARSSPRSRFAPSATMRRKRTVKTIHGFETSVKETSLSLTG